MSFQEKSTWAMGLIVAGVYGWYFATIFGSIETMPPSDIDYQGKMLATVVLLVVLAIVFHIAIALADPNGADQTDERDRLINRFGEYVGGFALATGALVALGMAMVEIDHFWIANTILATLVLSELVSAGTRIVMYRRGLQG